MLTTKKYCHCHCQVQGLCPGLQKRPDSLFDPLPISVSRSVFLIILLLTRMSFLSVCPVGCTLCSSDVQCSACRDGWYLSLSPDGHRICRGIIASLRSYSVDILNTTITEHIDYHVCSISDCVSAETLLSREACEACRLNFNPTKWWHEPRQECEGYNT